MSQPKEKESTAPNHGQDDYSSCVQIASQVFDLVAKHMTPPRPKTYTLWYSYAAGDNHTLRDEVEAILEKSGTLSDYDIDQILSEHEDQKQKEAHAQDVIERHFEKELSNIMDMVKVSVERNEDYSDTLGEANKQLPLMEDPQKIRDVVAQLLTRNREMQVQTEALNQSLSKSQEHIQALREDLAELRARSMKDPLTQLGNRGFFDATLAREMIITRQSQKPLCLVMSDIDHFKSVNDTHGHTVGDWILKDFASLLSKSIKGRDSAARYGGEEFSVILPMTDIKGAEKLVENIRQEFASKDRVLKSTGKSIEPVTASFGIAELRPSDDLLSLIKRADENLYAAKKAGRNQTVTD